MRGTKLSGNCARKSIKAAAASTSTLTGLVRISIVSFAGGTYGPKSAKFTGVHCPKMFMVLNPGKVVKKFEVESSVGLSASVVTLITPPMVPQLFAA